MFVITAHTVINKTKFALTDCGEITDCNILTFCFITFESFMHFNILSANNACLCLSSQNKFAYFVIRVTNLKDAFNYVENFRKYTQPRNFVLVEPFKNRFK